jgi:threonylcarbamoyladenosine tRNA methylthiotransferase MtaB
MTEALTPAKYPEASCISSAISAPEGRTRAYIKVEDGCDRFCSYCIIPIARGKVRSRPKDDIVSEARELIKNGYKELVVTGINTALYGTDFGRPDEILNLIGDIAKIDGDFRIRLGSLEPTVINAELARKLVKIEKLCPHLHLSLQSGSGKILKDMGRRYNRQEYLDIVEVLRESDENFAISTDIIVGYPGETDADFAESLDIVSRVKFSKVHVFKYSKRPGTRAAELANQIFKMPVRVGAPLPVGGLVEEYRSPVYAAAVGLVLEGNDREGKTGPDRSGGTPPRDSAQEGILKKLWDWIKGEFF